MGLKDGNLQEQRNWFTLSEHKGKETAKQKLSNCKE